MKSSAGLTIKGETLVSKINRNIDAMLGLAVGDTLDSKINSKMEAMFGLNSIGLYRQKPGCYRFPILPLNHVLHQKQNEGRFCLHQDELQQSREKFQLNLSSSSKHRRSDMSDPTVLSLQPPWYSLTLTPN